MRGRDTGRIEAAGATVECMSAIDGFGQFLTTAPLWLQVPLVFIGVITVCAPLAYAMVWGVDNLTAKLRVLRLEPMSQPTPPNKPKKPFGTSRVKQVLILLIIIVIVAWLLGR